MSLPAVFLLSVAITAALYVLFGKFLGGSTRLSASALENRVNKLLHGRPGSPKPNQKGSDENGSKENDHLQNYVDQIASSRKIANWLQLAGVTRPLYQILLTLMTASVVTFAVFVIFNWQLYLCFAAITMIWAGPYAYLNGVRSKYIKNFSEQLPNALSMMANTVLVGHTADSAIKLTTEVSPKPLSDEFNTIHKEMAFGASFIEALRNLQDRMPTTEVRIMVTALSIQQKTGGNLAEILQNLERMIRDYASIRREAKAMTAEGKMSMYIMCGLPFFVMVPQILRNPDPFFAFIATSQGKMVYGGAAILMIISIFLFNKLTTLEDF